VAALKLQVKPFFLEIGPTKAGSGPSKTSTTTTHLYTPGEKLREKGSSLTTFHGGIAALFFTA